MKKSEITILIVEDDATGREALSEAIKRFGYKVSAVAKPDDALSLLKIKSFHAAIVDVLLPKKNGIELVKEFRSLQFGKAPVILTSGIFRDKAFMQDAITRTQAVDYIPKPIDLKMLRAALESALSSLMETASISIPSLLSKAFVSPRERIKALETIEEISGFDLPFIMSLLMTDQVTGHLNISDDQGEIFGIGLIRGTIAKMDSADSQKILRELVIQKGFVTEEELNEIPKERMKSDIIRCLVAESLASPHALYPIVHQQILTELQKLFVDRKFKFNFSKDESTDVGQFLTLEQCFPLFNASIENAFTETYLQDFYGSWLQHPIRKSPHFQLNHPLFQNSTIQGCPDLIAKVDQELNLEEILGSMANRMQALKALHMLALTRLVIFDDVKRDKSALVHFEKLKDVLQNIENKDPVEIFVYFGASAEAKVLEVERIYKEFAKANHPDHVPPTAPAEIKTTVHKVFSLVSAAHDTLVNEEKRKKYYNEIKQVEFGKQVKAESLSDQAIGLLQKGKVKDSLALITEALSLHRSPTTIVYYAWIKLKSYPGVTPPKVIKEITESLDQIPHPERRFAAYQHVLGLVRKAQGDLEGAMTFFDRASLLDPNFIEASQEVEILQSQKKKSFDLLNGDITSIMSNIFKRK